MAKVTIYQDSQSQWRWNDKAKNGKRIAESDEGYVRPDSCIKGLEATAKALGNEEIKIAVKKNYFKKK